MTCCSVSCFRIYPGLHVYSMYSLCVYRIQVSQVCHVTMSVSKNRRLLVGDLHLFGPRALATLLPPTVMSTLVIFSRSWNCQFARAESRGGRGGYREFSDVDVFFHRIRVLPCFNGFQGFLFAYLVQNRACSRAGGPMC